MLFSSKDNYNLNQHFDDLFHTKKINYNKSNNSTHIYSENIEKNNNENNVKLLLDDNIMKYYVKILLKKEKNQKEETKKFIYDSTKNIFHKENKISNISDIEKVKEFTNNEIDSTANSNTKLKKKYITMKEKMNNISKAEIPKINIYSKQKKDENIFNKCAKTIYDFKYNISKLSHHWKDTQNNEIKEGINIKQKTKTENCMSAEEIYNLFGIENKNEEIKSKYFIII